MDEPLLASKVSKASKPTGIDSPRYGASRDRSDECVATMPTRRHVRSRHVRVWWKGMRAIPSRSTLATLCERED